MANLAVLNAQDSAFKIKRYSTSISRVNLKYQNYEAKKVEAIKEPSKLDASYELFYQPAIMLLQKMYEERNFDRA
jgi:hypothetical protein